jgi:tripartite motif-containing protein 71
MGGILVNSAGYMLVADGGNNRIQALTLTGSFIDQFPCTSGQCTASSANGQFSQPVQPAVDGNGNIWVTDNGNNRVEEFNSSGVWQKSLGGPSPYTCETSPAGSVPACAAGTGNGQFNGPWGITVDSGNNIWVVDSEQFSGNPRVEEFSNSGTYMGTIGGSGNTCGAANQFNIIQYLHFDSTGNLYVSDACGVIDEYSISGTTYTFVKSFGPPSPTTRRSPATTWTTSPSIPATTYGGTMRATAISLRRIMPGISYRK